MTTTTPSITQPIRQFRIGATNLADPDPTMPAQAVIDLYSGSYPALKFATVQPPRMEGEVMVIEATLPTVQTKGREDALDRLASWVAEPTSAPTALQRWHPVAQFLHQKLQEPAQPEIDAFLLPLA